MTTTRRKPAALEALAKITAGINAYSDAGSARKRALHAKGKVWLHKLACDLGLDTSEYDVRNNLGGIAVSGEVTLHSDTLYVQLSEHCFGGRAGVSVLYRTCSGRKDYCGHQNNTTTMSAVAADYEGFVARLRRMAETVGSAA
ncbi:hypothetical protein [Piscinibacter gummiphilus]|uniref:Uncharacterized protein n=1 Tax=Piscinibacter gummiphilus TaxID=946333 RepID=A0ABZ0CTQ6_9BURK|nr:hypothetical protein [Piscinibacter gummiphilus]WOB06491.1 hypothetical protein RXV79_16335 [Piscinibacter gummiphilus]